jgi:hypothetical protein
MTRLFLSFGLTFWTLCVFSLRKKVWLGWISLNSPLGCDYGYFCHLFLRAIFCRRSCRDRKPQ